MLQQIQIDTIKSAVDRAIAGEKDAITFLATLKAQQDGNSKEMTELAEQLQAEKGVGFGTPITGVNLQPVQLQAVRQHVTGAKNGDAVSINFWKMIELQAANTGDPQSKDLLKARAQVMAAEATQAAAPPAPAATGGPARARSMEELLAEAEGKSSPMPAASAKPTVSVTPATPIQAATDLALITMYREEVLKARDEILKAREQILAAISGHSPTTEVEHVAHVVSNGSAG